MEKCSYAKKCGGCQYQGIAYEEQLKEKAVTILEEAPNAVENVVV